MLSVFRIHADLASPRVRLPSEHVDALLRVIDQAARGQKLDAPFETLVAEVDRPPRHREFCYLAPGTLTIRDADLEDDSGLTAMYYALWWNSVRIDLRTSIGNLACFVPSTTVTPEPAFDSPFAITALPSAVFRIRGQPSQQLFCVSGTARSGDEFERAYAEGFAGLRLEAVWAIQP
jgi:hypothetical protein